MIKSYSDFEKSQINNNDCWLQILFNNFSCFSFKSSLFFKCLNDLHFIEGGIINFITHTSILHEGGIFKPTARSTPITVVLRTIRIRHNKSNSNIVNLNSLLLYELVDTPPMRVGLGNRKCPLPVWQAQGLLILNKQQSQAKTSFFASKNRPRCRH